MRSPAADEAYCRLTVLAPRARVDVALPADVPVAELVPMVLELVGEPGPGGAPQPWRLSGAAGGPLPPEATLDELGVPDGELLRIAPDAPAPPPPVFDDPVDALAATAGTARAGDRRFGAAAVFVVTVAAAGLLATAAPGSAAAAGLAGLGAVAAVVHAARLIRRPSDQSDPDADEVAHAAARTAACAAVPLAAAAGWVAVPGAPGSGLLLAAAAAGIAAAAAQVVLRVIAPLLVGAVVAAVLVAAGAVGLRFGMAPAAAAAAVGAIAIVAGPLLPRAALRLAGLPRPVVPADSGELVDADTGPDLLPPDELAERADLARGYLAGLTGGCAVVAAAGAVIAATGGGWAGPTFAGVTVAILGLRARGYADAAPAQTALVAAIGAGIALVALIAGQAEPGTRPVAAGVLLVAVAVGLHASGRTGPIGSPVSRRAVDLLSGLLTTAAIPLALGAMDLFRLVRGL